MEQRTTDIQDLILKCKRGDEKARFRLYRMYSKMMFNVIVRLVPNTGDAEDILQESFIKAFKSINKLESYKAVGGWLKRIAINESLNFLRRRKIQFQSLEVVETASEEEVEWDGVPMELIQQNIKMLPEGCRLVFTLFLLEEYSHKEIAEKLKISESTSKTQYKRAKQLLKQGLMVHYERR